MTNKVRPAKTDDEKLAMGYLATHSTYDLIDMILELYSDDAFHLLVDEANRSQYPKSYYLANYESILSRANSSKA